MFVWQRDLLVQTNAVAIKSVLPLLIAPQRGLIDRRLEIQGAPSVVPVCRRKNHPFQRWIS